VVVKDTSTSRYPCRQDRLGFFLHKQTVPISPSTPNIDWRVATNSSDDLADSKTCIKSSRIPIRFSSAIGIWGPDLDLRYSFRSFGRSFINGLKE